jgi:exodeoxyribonuclease VII small subunit
MSNPSSSPTKTSSDELPFEDALEKLEAIVTELEEGKTPLDKLIQKFEEGTKWIQLCRTHLEVAELKIEKLKENLGTVDLDQPDPK